MLNNKFKKWALFTIVLFSLLSLDDYSVFVLQIPSIDQLNVSTGRVLIKLGKSGGKGSTSADHIYLLEHASKNKYSCRVNSQDNTNCISRLDERFYSKTKNISGSVSIEPTTSNSKKFGRIFWYEGSFFGPLKERRLLQLDVGGTTVISYENQKKIYEQKRAGYKYVASLLLIFSLVVFGVLQLSSIENICRSAK